MHKALSEPAQGWELGLGDLGTLGLGGEVVVGDRERFSSSFCLQGIGYTLGVGEARRRVAPEPGRVGGPGHCQLEGQGSRSLGPRGWGHLWKLEPPQACPWSHGEEPATTRGVANAPHASSILLPPADPGAWETYPKGSLPPPPCNTGKERNRSQGAWGQDWPVAFPPWHCNSPSSA